MDGGSKLAGGLFLVIVFAVIAVFLKYFLASTDEVKAAIMSAIAVIGAAIYTQHKTRIHEAEARLFKEKAEAYMKFYDLTFDMMFSLSKGKDVSFEDDESLRKIIELKKAIFVWGSSETLMAWKKFEDNPDTSNVLIKVNDIFKCFRKDLGHWDNSLPNLFYISYILKSGETEKLANLSSKET